MRDSCPSYSLAFRFAGPLTIVLPRVAAFPKGGRGLRGRRRPLIEELDLRMTPDFVIVNAQKS
jgi:hypothetical protein